MGENPFRHQRSGVDLSMWAIIRCCNCSMHRRLAWAPHHFRQAKKQKKLPGASSGGQSISDIPINLHAATWSDFLGRPLQGMTSGDKSLGFCKLFLLSGFRKKIHAQ